MKGSVRMEYVKRNSELGKITQGDIVQVYLSAKNSSGKCVQEGTRPMVIISNNVCNNVSPVVTALPCTSSIVKINKNMPTHVIIDELEGTGLTKRSVVMAEQITSIDKRDIVAFLGTIPKKYLNPIKKAAMVQLAL